MFDSRGRHKLFCSWRFHRKMSTALKRIMGVSANFVYNFRLIGPVVLAWFFGKLTDVPTNIKHTLYHSYKMVR